MLHTYLFIVLLFATKLLAEDPDEIFSNCIGDDEFDCKKQILDDFEINSVENERYYGYYSISDDSSSSEERCKYGRCTTKKNYRKTTTTRRPGYYKNCQVECPKYISKKSTLFNSDGNLINPENYGKIISSSTCQKSYLISNSKMNWTNAYATCEKLGMKLISFDTQKDMKCFNTVIKDKGNSGRWWTSGTDKGCTKRSKNVWTWCSIKTDFSKTWWENDHSDRYDNNNKQCATIDVIVNTSRGNVYYLSKKRCKSYHYYVCEYSSDINITDDCVAECPHCHKKDHKLFDASGNLKNPNQYGNWLSFPSSQFTYQCPYTYLLSNEKLSWYDAYKKCCRLGMKLLSLNSIDDVVCFNSLLLIYGTVGTWWTSGTDHECSSNTKEVYTWCATNTSVPDILWTNTKPKDFSEYDRCMLTTFEITFPPHYLSAKSCKDKNKFVCQGPITTLPPTVETCSVTCPSCPAKDPLLFDIQGNLINPNQYGDWVPSPACGRNYLLSNEKLNWFAANDKCCHLGMKLVSMPTIAEFLCFNFDLLINFKLGSWWTSGTDETCESKLLFKWCGTGTSVSSIPWGIGEPNNLAGNEKCIMTELVPNIPASAIYDKNCNDLNYYACEGPTTTSTTPPPTVGDVPDTCEATCPSCPSKDLSLFDLTGQLINRNQYGSWLSSVTCAKDYLVSNEKLNWFDAYKKCCHLGMKLASFNNEFDFVCFNTLNAAVGFLGDWWTSGTDEGCTSATKTVWTWCGVNEHLISKFWAPGLPTPLLSGSKCINIVIQNGIPPLFYAQSDCATLKYYACEISDLPSKDLESATVKFDIPTLQM